MYFCVLKKNFRFFLLLSVTTQYFFMYFCRRKRNEKTTQKDLKIMTTQEAERANEIIQGYNLDYSVRLSVDGEYLILDCGDRVVHCDSACEDVYDWESAAWLFKTIIDAEERGE